MPTTPQVTTKLTKATIEEFCDHLSMQGCSVNTVRAYRADLNGWRLWQIELALPGLQPGASAARYLTTRRASWAPKTTRRKLAAIRAWASWVGYPGFLDGYKTPTPAAAIPHPMSEGIPGVLAMLDKCKDPQSAALVALTGLCGLRISEALAVQVSHIDDAERTLRVRGKGDKERIVPISERAWTVIASARILAKPGLPLVNLPDRTARRRITSLGKRAGLSRGIASHDMRATLATAAYNKSHNLRAVQELLGHASSQTTETYTGVSAAAMRDAVDLGAA
jgi:site-specific recombinase XerD